MRGSGVTHPGCSVESLMTENTPTLESTIVLLSQPGCQGCRAVSRRLDEAGVDYLHVDVSEDAYWARELESRGIKRVPVTIKGETWIEGYDPDAIDRLF